MYYNNDNTNYANLAGLGAVWNMEVTEFKLMIDLTTSFPSTAWK